MRKRIRWTVDFEQMKFYGDDLMHDVILLFILTTFLGTAEIQKHFKINYYLFRI